MPNPKSKIANPKSSLSSHHGLLDPDVRAALAYWRPLAALSAIASCFRPLKVPTHQVDVLQRDEQVAGKRHAPQRLRHLAVADHPRLRAAEPELLVRRRAAVPIAAEDPFLGVRQHL